MEQSNKTAQWRLTEIEHGAPLADLIEARLAQGKTLSQIAPEFGVHLTTLIRWCEQLGLRVERRYVLVRDEGLVGAAN